MKTKNFYLTLAAFTGLALTACTSEDIVNEVNAPAPDTPVAMSFDVHAKNQTRGTLANNSLANAHSNFGVWAVKTTGTSGSETTTTEMNNFQVNWVADNSDKTKGAWVYDGVNSQKLKYWDKTANKYDFFAYAPKVGRNTSNTVSCVTDGTKTSYGTITFADFAISNSVNDEVLAATKQVGTNDIGKDVPLAFNRYNCKVGIEISTGLGSDYSVQFTGNITAAGTIVNEVKNLTYNGTTFTESTTEGDKVTASTTLTFLEASSSTPVTLSNTTSFTQFICPPGGSSNGALTFSFTSLVSTKNICGAS